ncbi:hypothetical protein EVA_05017 [gut metagenome]|uniref:Uncharacterized protein n=1 Tax=gut metagenome TaxID=749906 RepID=J9GVE7_9ZZZZ
MGVVSQFSDAYFFPKSISVDFVDQDVVRLAVCALAVIHGNAVQTL